MNETPKRLLHDHGILLPFGIITLFGSGYNTIPLFAWLYFPLLIFYIRHNNHDYKKILLAYLTSSLCFSFSYAGNFSTNVDTDLERFPLAWFVLVASLIVHLLLLVPVLLADKYVLSNTTTTSNNAYHCFVRIGLFPSLWAGLGCLMARFGPLGDYPSLSTSVVTWPAFAQIASLGGRSMIDFLMALFGTCTFELVAGTPLLQHFSEHQQYADHSLPDSRVVEQESTSTNNQKECHKWWPMVFYSLVMGCALTVGGIATNIHKGSFFQTNYPQYVPKTMPVGCVVGPGTDYPDLQPQHDLWFNKSMTLAEAGAKLIIWSELTTSVTDMKEEESLLQKAKAFAREHKVYLGITYGREKPVSQNKFVLVTKEGDIGIDYNKAHPVPGVETQPAGPEVLQYVDTEEFGRVGGGICFDYNFPHFIAQASTHHVDVMLQPSWTWGPIGTYHQQGNVLRAVENGFTLFRCVSQGVSGIFEPTLDGIFNQKVASLNVEEYMFYLPLQKKLFTLYALVGDAFGYLCLMTSLASVVYTALRQYKKSLIGRIQLISENDE